MVAMSVPCRYGDARCKCTQEGRALMQLDFQQLVGRLERLVRPLPHKAFVENYIKAYYLPESSLEQWISTHTAIAPPLDDPDSCRSTRRIS